METTSVFLFFSLLYFQVLFEEKNSAIMKGKERKRTSYQKHAKLLKVSVCVCVRAGLCVFVCVVQATITHECQMKKTFSFSALET